MDSILTTIRPELLEISKEHLFALSPLLIVLAGAILTMFASMSKKQQKWLVFSISVLLPAFAAYTAFCYLGSPSLFLFNHSIVVDSFSSLFSIIFIGAAILSALSSFHYLEKEGLHHPEYYILLLFSLFGMILMALTVDLVVLFIALEIMSIAIYVLVGFRRNDRKANEASIKYFILGSAASAIFLYGVALLYGATQTTNILHILAYVNSNPNKSSIFILGAWLASVGFLFKVGAVPFHMWLPDVYEGAPAPITGFMATGLKAAAFAALLRFAFAIKLERHFSELIWICSVATMIIGNLVALSQTNLKRMLAYSSIAHTGYILIGFLAVPQSDQALSSIVFYLIAYVAMNVGAFVILSILSGRADANLNLHDIAGLSRKHPWIAFSLAVLMLSMAGIPPTAGFMAKYLIFYSAIQADQISIAIIGVLCSAISVFYYLRILVQMYMKEGVNDATPRTIPVWSAIAVAIAVVLTIQIGIMPSKIVAPTKKAISSL